MSAYIPQPGGPTLPVPHTKAEREAWERECKVWQKKQHEAKLAARRARPKGPMSVQFPKPISDPDCIDKCIEVRPPSAGSKTRVLRLRLWHTREKVLNIEGFQVNAEPIYSQALRVHMDDIDQLIEALRYVRAGELGRMALDRADTRGTVHLNEEGAYLDPAVLHSASAMLLGEPLTTVVREGKDDEPTESE